VFGLTGGIGSGKSSVGAHFQALGLPVVDADQLARDAVAVGSEGLSEIVRRFGADVLAPDGSLDRAALGRRVFSNPDERRALEAITHPRVRALARDRFATLEAQGEPLACYEVPLLFEAGLEKTYSPVVVVAVPAELQATRAAVRDGVTRETIQRRISAQLPLAEKMARADFVIDNGGSLDATKLRAEQVLRAICDRFGIPVDRYAAKTKTRAS
jgi:dephospho-CoA kinase